MKIVIDGQEVSLPPRGSAGEVYSTEETRIGTWIDGKPLYRKVFSGTASPNATVVSKPISDLNIDFVINLHGVITRAIGDIIPVSTYSTDTQTVPSLNADKNSVVLQAATSGLLAGQPYYIALEYTKTTD